MSGKHRPAPFCDDDVWNDSQESEAEGDRLVFDRIERDALRDEGLDPDDPAAATAIDLVRWELSLLRFDPDGTERG